MCAAISGILSPWLGGWHLFIIVYPLILGLVLEQMVFNESIALNNFSSAALPLMRSSECELLQHSSPEAAVLMQYFFNRGDTCVDLYIDENLPMPVHDRAEQSSKPRSLQGFLP